MPHRRKSLEADSPRLTSNDVDIPRNSWAKDSCCSFKAWRRDEQWKIMPEISLPFYPENKSFLRSFPLLTNKPSLKCWGKLYSPKMATPIYLSHPTCSFYMINTSPTEGHVLSPWIWEGTCDSFDQQSRAEVMLCDFWGRLIKRIQLPSGALSPAKLLEPSDHVDTMCECSSWAPADTSINCQTA